MMSPNHESKTEALVWISEAGKRDIATLRFNRRKIRQQAMRHAMITNQHRTRRQPKTFKFVDGFSKSHVVTTQGDGDEDEGISPPELKYAPARIAQQAKRWIIHSPKRNPPDVSILQQLAQTGYEEARIKYQFDLLDLSTFTSVHMGRAAATALHNSRSTMRGLLRMREESFLDFIPQFYATSQLLQSVVDCVLARAQRIVSPNSQFSEAAVFSLYGRALRKLQEALNHNNRVYEPDVLCSIQVMQLFEVLDFSKPDFWTRHTSGITRLIQMRGPRRYQTEFERSLLCSQLGTIFGESMLQNKDCFLGELEWQVTLHELITTNGLKYSPIVVGIWSLEVLLPRMIRQTNEIILSAVHDVETVAMLLLNLRYFRNLSLQWREKVLACADSTQQDEFKLPENLATAYAGYIIANRAIVALNPLHPDAAHFEAETMDLGEQIMQTAEQLRATASRGDLLIARTLQVATMALACHGDFNSAIEGNTEYVDQETGYVTLRVWQHFNGLMGRKVVSGFLKREDLLREIQQTGCWPSNSGDREALLDGTLYGVKGVTALSARRASVGSLVSDILKNQWI